MFCRVYDFCLLAKLFESAPVRQEKNKDLHIDGNFIDRTVQDSSEYIHST